MLENWVNVIAQAIFFGSPLIALGVGIAYFVKARSTASIFLRLITSAFGPVAALMFLAGILWPDHYRYTPRGAEAFNLLQVAPLVLLTIALIKYPGDRRLHFILVPIGLIAWAGSFALGWLLINGE